VFAQSSRMQIAAKQYRLNAFTSFRLAWWLFGEDAFNNRDEALSQNLSKSPASL
jgi:hypothetical protein